MPGRKRSITATGKRIKFEVVEVAKNDLAGSRKAGKTIQAWNPQDVWPGSASVAAIKKGKGRVIVTIVIDEKKPGKS